MHYKTIILLVLGIQAMVSCGLKSSVYEKNESPAHQKWQSSKPILFDFEIADTSQLYKVFLTMRHTDAYEFSNIWVELKTIPPSKKDTSVAKIEVHLANNEGKWLGRMFDEIVEHKSLITPGAKSIKFKEKGQYQIRLKQIMRKDPLPEILSVGLRVEKELQ